MVSKETAKGRAQAVQARSDVRGGIGAKCGVLGGHGAPCDLPPPRDLHTFVQFAGVVVVHDSRGLEQLADRAKVGQLLGDHGLLVSSIVLDGDWFEITADHPSRLSPPATYRVPVTNVRSARR